ncbi:tetratricopeptide repeat protein [Chitinophaga vietnamensis]|uniref:tetratricopeptide repeat protein n=1 Tax=Chitinophaga vietnamensis TaxID=2593957 RepID=UPI00117754EF|nr:tetratricopeptide repeat protein [Chitinophaga vietnamensis]
MTIKEIEKLYEEQHFESALNATNALLAQHPGNKELLYIRARCLFDLSLATHSATQASQLMQDAYKAFNELLALDPTHAGALSYRAYIGAYSPYVENEAARAIADCAQLLKDADPAARLRYLEWRSQAFMRQGDSNAALADIQQIITETPAVYRDEQPLRNVLLGRMHYTAGTILHTHQKNKAAALAQYHAALAHAPWQHDYLPAATLAMELGDYDFVASLLTIIPKTLSEITDEFAALLESTRHAYERQPTRATAHLYCYATATFPEITLASDDTADIRLQQISLGKKLIQQFPEEGYFWNYTGRALFLAKQYANALPYFEKGIALKPLPMILARWAYAKYKTEGHFPASLPAIEHDMPYDWYEAGMSLDDWQVLSYTDNDARDKLVNEIYGRAIQQYKAYWFENSGTPMAHHEHHFAMCCNNYGLSLANLQRYEEAIDIHTIGYEMSPFWEQINSRGYANRSAGRYAQAVEDWATVLEYAEILDPERIAGTYSLLIDACMSGLNDPQRALQWYEQFMALYHESLAEQIEQLDHDEREAAQHQVNQITTARGLIAGDDLPQRIQLLEKHLEKYPDDSDSYFNLMQLYYQNGQYELCAGAATSRLSIGGFDKIPAYSKAKIYYFRGRAYLKTGNYERALPDLQECHVILSGDANTTDTDLFMLYGYLTQSAVGVHNNLAAIGYGKKCIAINDENDWAWDEDTATFAFALANAYKNNDQTKEAIQILKRITEQMPDYKAAAVKLKEWKPKWSLF